MTIPGTTGAGKTTAILSLLCSALAQGSGFVLVDGKADRQLCGRSSHWPAGSAARATCAS